MLLIFKLDCSLPLESTTTTAHLSGQLHTRIADRSMLGTYHVCLKPIDIWKMIRVHSVMTSNSKALARGWKFKPKLNCQWGK